MGTQVVHNGIHVLDLSRDPRINLGQKIDPVDDRAFRRRCARGFPTAGRNAPKDVAFAPVVHSQSLFSRPGLSPGADRHSLGFRTISSRHTTNCWLAVGCTTAQLPLYGRSQDRHAHQTMFLGCASETFAQQGVIMRLRLMANALDLVEICLQAIQRPTGRADRAWAVGQSGSITSLTSSGVYGWTPRPCGHRPTRLTSFIQALKSIYGLWLP